MKKFLLSMVAVLGFGAVASAASVTLPEEGKVWSDYTWTKDGANYKAEIAGYSLLLDKGDSQNDLVAPNQYSIRVYAGAKLTVTATTGAAFKNVVVGVDNTSKATAATASAGWTVSAFANDAFTMTSETAQSTVTFQGAENKQLRVATLTISDEAGSVTPDPEPGPTPDVVTVKSVAEIKALTDGDKFVTDFTLQVGFVRYSNIFVCDPAGDFIQIYGKNELKVGDIIPAGLEGSYKLYNSTTPEIENATIPAATEGTFVAKVVPAADVNVGLVNSVITIKDVVLAEATPAAKENFTGKVGDIELSLRNNYELESVPAGTYNITVVVTNFKGDASLYVVDYYGNVGINDITLDENAPVEYFNLQGIRVAEPQAGQIVIRRQGDKVQKVLVK